MIGSRMASTMRSTARRRSGALTSAGALALQLNRSKPVVYADAQMAPGERRITAPALGAATLQGRRPALKKKPERSINEFRSKVFFRLRIRTPQPDSIRAAKRATTE